MSDGNSLSGIRDNRARGPAHKFLSSKAVPDSKLSIVSAYFTSFAYDQMAKTLDEIAGLRFLFGEPRFLDSIDSDSLCPPAFSLDEDGLTLTQGMRKSSAASRCADWIRSRVEVRSVKRAGLLHGKLFHVDDGRREHAMVGSSNFTLKGLGFTDEPNIELNLIVDSDRDRDDLRKWFDEIWSDESLTEDVRDEVLGQLERLYRHNSPEFVYFKTLYHLFGKFLSDQTLEEERLNDARFTETAIWQMLFEFQRDGVRALLSKLDRHNGCILADSVGLGKTYVALAAIKWFELRNQRVLVLCPKKLRDNWTEFLAQNNNETNPLLADKFSYTVLSHTDLTRTAGRVGDINLGTVNWGNYDLVVIDESHNFRTASRGKSADENGPGRTTRYEKLLDEVIRSGIKTKVLMLSATPVNNDLSDLKSQLDLMLASKPDAFAELGVNNLGGVIGDARRKFKDWIKAGGKDRDALIGRLPPALFNLLDGVTIARSRKHVEKHYTAAMDAIGHFPTRDRPVSIFSQIDVEGQFPAFAHVHDQISDLKLALYNPISYVNDDKRHLYDPGGNFDQGNRERFLIGIIKTGLLKRLESSVNSFASSMARLCDRIDARLRDIGEFQAGNVHALANTELPDETDGDEELETAFEVGGALKFNLAHMKIDDWAKALQADRARLDALRVSALAVTPPRDAKLADLKKILTDKATNPTTNRSGEANRKVIVFTAFSDTAEYLYEQLVPFAKELGLNAALVTGGGATKATFGKARYQDILINFAPRAKKRAGMKALKQDAEIDLLIATDCISEGQNLQDADLLVNFDIHWNPVRLIQRFGRIDRIGSLNDRIKMVNFWPTPDLNHYINLKGRVEARMALVDLSATGDDNILADAKEAAEADLQWRDKQLLRLKDEVFDLEDGQEGVTLAEFSLEDFRADLLQFARENEEELRTAPIGISAIAPVAIAGGTLDPGVIFCLKRNGDIAKGSEKAVGGLDPFFLVYVRDDGSIRHGFASPKTILDAMRALCLGRSEPFEALCQAFDAETGKGQHMEAYDKLAIAAVNSIRASYATRALGALAAGRGGKLADETAQPRHEGDFELITWLIVRGEGETA
ncbi:helicase-related protein [Novosphingobium sp. PASSN1]|uniref:helicase-related protein n=1 Tax=Novosphingobium sp. PASSN1 TaxID=2015561 RepID=UPI000BD9854B|nr:helicase-related protein [Novosphingobium sp. PASSN1]OYU34062.1 MAG: ATP-dependent helicase [Novosphingobium sp. PASSN1]